MARMNRWTWSIGTAVFLFACAALVGVWRIRRGGDKSPLAIESQDRDPAWRAQVKLGAAVYARHCPSCHGASLEGQPDWKKHLADGSLPAPPLTRLDTPGITRTRSSSRP
jgi:mono/diheme cytochrome c family protein